MTPKKTNVYIDGFNLYYGILRRNYPGFKWLNLEEWLTKLLPPAQFDIQKIYFFTARVSATPRDPQKPVRQDIYFRALKTLPKVKVVEGYFLFKKMKIYVNENVEISARIPEEKGTDVNLATYFVHEAHKKEFETGVIVSNDSDMCAAVDIVSQELGLEVGVINPCTGPYSKELTRNAKFKKQARDGQIVTSQFPATLTDSVGTFTKPQGW